MTEVSSYADIALAFPSFSPFQYAIPQSLKKNIEIGQRVFVPVRNRKRVGYVVGFSQNPAAEEIKDIESIIDARPILDASFLELTRWMSDYTLCSWGQAIEAALPAPFKKGKWLMTSRSAKSHKPAELLNPKPLLLTAHQKKAFDVILNKIHTGEAGQFLLHGITGSGKTEVYMQLIGELLKKSKSSIVLVPEISLTPQAVERFVSRFDEEVAVIHSRLSPARRVEEWHRIREGRARVVVGARSAIFSPVRDLGLIIIDEEHDTSYKQDETPRYQTRTVAAKRSELEKAVVVLGSATPSLESYFASQTGEITRLELPERIEKRPLPEVQVVDMRREAHGKREPIFSRVLEEQVLNTLTKKEQTILFLNRRGFSTYLHCSSCGYVASCNDCRVGLTYHFDKAKLVCHSCEYTTVPMRLCPGCQKSNLHYFGIGTQKVEEEARRLFPGARIGRMDTDSTSRKYSHETILNQFKKREIDILIGTQMIAKGHDFPYVSLIGVISADTALHLPDFRAAERTFGILTQVSGRAGRGDIPGKVLVQSYVPGHYAIIAAKDHNYLEFYEKEIIFRKELEMPPFRSLVQLIVTGSSEKEVVNQILRLSYHLGEEAKEKSFRVLGPAPCVISKERGQFRWNLYVKGPSIPEINAWLTERIRAFKKVKISLTIDVDPQ